MVTFSFGRRVAEAHCRAIDIVTVQNCLCSQLLFLIFLIWNIYQYSIAALGILEVWVEAFVFCKFAYLIYIGIVSYHVFLKELNKRTQNNFMESFLNMKEKIIFKLMYYNV